MVSTWIINGDNMGQQGHKARAVTDPTHETIELLLVDDTAKYDLRHQHMLVTVVEAPEMAFLGLFNEFQVMRQKRTRFMVSYILHGTGGKIPLGFCYMSSDASFEANSASRTLTFSIRSERDHRWSLVPELELPKLAKCHATKTTERSARFASSHSGKATPPPYPVDTPSTEDVSETLKSLRPMEPWFAMEEVLDEGFLDALNAEFDFV